MKVDTLRDVLNVTNSSIYEKQSGPYEARASRHDRQERVGVPLVEDRDAHGYLLRGFPASTSTLGVREGVNFSRVPTVEDLAEPPEELA